MVVVALAALTMAGSAYAAEFGAYHLSSPVSGAGLDGSRANIDSSSISPDANNCIVYSSVVRSYLSAAQLEVGKAECGSNAKVDNCTATTSQYEFFVERIPASGTTVCYAHGLTANGQSDLMTVDDASGTGTWYAYIDGNQEEGQSGYNDNEDQVSEWAEYSGNACFGWSGAASFSSWQKYYNGSWQTVTPDAHDNTCWFLSTISGGNFSVSNG